MKPEIKLTSVDKKLIRIASRYLERDPEKINDEVINRINTMAISPREKKKNLVKASKKIKTTTYVIPVAGGAITGYYFHDPGLIERDGNIPMIIFYHGGGWMYGNMEFYSAFLSHLAEETEAAVLLVDYRLSPSHKFPTAIEDCYDALLWAAEGAKYWKIDTARIYVAGDSVGGSLAAVCSVLARDRKGPMLAGQILLYPLTDGRLRTTSMAEYSDSPMLSEKLLSFYIKNYEREPKDILSPMFSPLLSPDLSRLPDALIITAELDPLKDDGELYAKALSDAGSKARVLQAYRSFHGFMPYKDSFMRPKCECAIKQMLSGRQLENIQLVTKKELAFIKKNS